MTPLQTASTVRPGAYRLSGQASLSPWCGFSLPSPASCSQIPSRAVPLPELRLAARHGLAEGFDLGASLHGAVVVPSGVQAGVLVEGKAEVWSRAAGERRHVLSVGPGIGFTHQQFGVFGGLELTSEAALELVLPAYYGYQTPKVEWVVSPRYVERLYLHDLDRDGRREVLDYGTFGLAAGLQTRGALRLGVGLEYLAANSFPAQGTFTLSAGVAYELGGGAGDAPKERDLLPE